MNTTLPILFQRRHILPDGRLPIRIAPGIQMDTIKEALKNNGIFGVCMYDPSDEQQFYEIGTRVQIEDFEPELVDGLLQITVIGLDNFEVQAFGEGEETGIYYGECKILSRWPDAKLSVTQQLLAERLEIMYEKYPELADLHDDKQLSNLSWLCQRWLEILPVPVREKQWLLNRPNCLETSDYLMSIMLDPH
ncbi:LON peptidase substrate-binding domain-containing protein [Thaumasiovibrio subtropicus]|uniref:LON peptidase substrate-binding domain-containing protein n=1 Tax=Thaumasiovibrio subtropicus TaxID=1891207 RepID=UPI000B358487|nr:LON peptidase substrate-binding domain-containing protein [Thaumasiovibrio subtropicus]